MRTCSGWAETHPAVWCLTDRLDLKMLSPMFRTIFFLNRHVVFGSCLGLLNVTGTSFSFRSHDWYICTPIIYAQSIDNYRCARVKDKGELYPLVRSEPFPESVDGLGPLGTDRDDGCGDLRVLLDELDVRLHVLRQRIVTAFDDALGIIP